jgi:hypothetical protein
MQTLGDKAKLSTTSSPPALGESLLSLFFFLVVLGFGVWTQGFELAKQVLYLNHTSSPFCSGCFGDGGLKNYLPELILNLDPPHLSLPSSYRLTGVSHQSPALFSCHH